MNTYILIEHITRSVLRRLTLNEEDSRVKKIKDTIRDSFTDDKIDIDVRYNKLRAFFDLRQNSDLTLLRFIAPIAYSDEVKFEIDNSKQAEQNKLREIAHFLKAKTDLFNEIKDKVSSFKDLCNEVEPYLEEKKKQKEEELSKGNFTGGGDYDILEDVDYETANYYGKYSYSEDPLCYTEDEDTWDGFKDEGKNKCYILLRKGWKDIEEKRTEPLYDFLPYSAYDEYGLSMIFVFVTPSNYIAFCNTRWNHSADFGRERSVDHALEKWDLTKLIGEPYESVFSGYPKVTFENAQGLLDSGRKPKEVFDEVYNYDEGFAIVELNDKANFIDTEGKLISKQWFDFVFNFLNGSALVQLDGEYYKMDREGNLSK